MKLSTARYRDASLQAGGLEGWEQVYDQLDAGHFDGEVVHFSDDSVRFFHERQNLKVSQRFIAPDDQRHIVIPLNWCNEDFVRSDGIYIQPRCERFHSVTPANAAVAVISVPLERYPWLCRDDHRLRLLNVAPGVARAARDQLAEVARCLLEVAPESQQCAMHAAQRLITNALMLLMEQQAPELIHESSARRNSRYIVERCHQWVEQHPEKPPTVLELCQHLRISRRTLQYSFQREAMVNPVQYTRALRLNAARRRLLGTPSLQVSQAALEQGFTNLSYFTQQYQRLFDELPSELNRQPH